MHCIYFAKRIIILSNARIQWLESILALCCARTSMKAKATQHNVLCSTVLWTGLKSSWMRKLRLVGSREINQAEHTLHLQIQEFLIRWNLITTDQCLPPPPLALARPFPSPMHYLALLQIIHYLALTSFYDRHSEASQFVPGINPLDQHVYPATNHTCFPGVDEGRARDRQAHGKGSNPPTRVRRYHHARYIVNYHIPSSTLIHKHWHISCFGY